MISNSIFKFRLDLNKILKLNEIDFVKKIPVLEKADVEYINVQESEPLRNECQHFVDVVLGKLEPLTDGSEGLRVLNVLSAASLS